MCESCPKKGKTMSKKKLAVIVPGIGYTCDRSLLYYAGKTAQQKGYDVLRISFEGFPKGEKGDPEFIQRCFNEAQRQMTQQLQEVDWSAYKKVAFIAKSIGTAAAADYLTEYGIDAKLVLYTPLVETFRFVTKGKAVAFHGTADPWAKTDGVVGACEALEIPLFLVENANHSLETGDVKTDLKTLKDAIRIVRKYL